MKLAPSVRERMRAPFAKSVVAWSGLAVAFGSGACGSTGPSSAMIDARAAIERAQGGPGAKNRPEELREAEVVYQRALAFAADGEDDAADAYAYVAKRKVERADADGRSADLLAQRRQAEAELAASREDEIRRARAAVAKAQLDVEQARRAREEAEKRAADALAKLATSSVATVERQSRGTVITLSGSVLFASGQASLVAGARERLEQLADALLLQREQQIVVEGHSDSKGVPSANVGLSERRAVAVRNFLIDRGVAPDRVRAQGLGASRPVATNTTAEGRANNRRVEIVLLAVPVFPATSAGGR